jgi:hypothetical protein
MTQKLRPACARSIVWPDVWPNVWPNVWPDI